MGKLRGWLLILSLVTLLGCAAKVSEENFHKIKTGMTVAEIEHLLGPPSQVATIRFGDVDGTHAIWENRNATISIQFFNGIVRLKSFSQGVTRPRD